VSQLITCGVPQGSVLGPLLFIVYANDLANSSKLGEFVTYADDTNVIYSHIDPNELSALVNSELKYVSSWFSNNKLAVNVEKTNFIVFKTIRNPIQAITLTSK
jgi:hypothetical protein